MLETGEALGQRHPGGWNQTDPAGRRKDRLGGTGRHERSRDEQGHDKAEEGKQPAGGAAETGKTHSGRVSREGDIGVGGACPDACLQFPRAWPAEVRSVKPPGSVREPSTLTRFAADTAQRAPAFRWHRAKEREWRNAAFVPRAPRYPARRLGVQGSRRDHRAQSRRSTGTMQAVLKPQITISWPNGLRALPRMCNGCGKRG